MKKAITKATVLLITLLCIFNSQGLMAQYIEIKGQIIPVDQFQRPVQSPDLHEHRVFIEEKFFGRPESSGIDEDGKFSCKYPLPALSDSNKKVFHFRLTIKDSNKRLVHTDTITLNLNNPEPLLYFLVDWKKLIGMNEKSISSDGCSELAEELADWQTRYKNLNRACDKNTLACEDLEQGLIDNQKTIGQLQREKINLKKELEKVKKINGDVKVNKTPAASNCFCVKLAQNAKRIRLYLSSKNAKGQAIPLNSNNTWVIFKHSGIHSTDSERALAIVGMPNAPFSYGRYIDVEIPPGLNIASGVIEIRYHSHGISAPEPFILTSQSFNHRSCFERPLANRSFSDLQNPPSRFLLAGKTLEEPKARRTLTSTSYRLMVSYQSPGNSIPHNTQVNLFQNETPLPIRRAAAGGSGGSVAIVYDGPFNTTYGQSQTNLFLDIKTQQRIDLKIELINEETGVAIKPILIPVYKNGPSYVNFPLNH